MISIAVRKGTIILKRSLANVLAIIRYPQRLLNRGSEAHMLAPYILRDIASHIHCLLFVDHGFYVKKQSSRFG